MEKICLVKDGEKKFLDVERVGAFGKIRGLMFRRREDAPTLLFDFEKPVAMPIHSFFCPVFLAVWLDGGNNVVEKKVVTPWKLRVLPDKKFCKLIEIPLNNKYSEIIRFLDGNKKI